MRKQLALILAMVALSGACNENRDRDTGALDNDRSGTDTVVQSETVKDTTVIEADTSIDVDTVKQTDNIDDSAKDKN
ncbi:MAG TPA: hypothetical protein VH764_02070 [Gemmatimonadales bacterium]|jgi:hypothetical protein